MAINENRLRNIVRGELRNMGFELNEGLNKGDAFSLSGMKPEQMARIIASKYGVNPNDFVVKKVAKQRISKPEDMSIEDYKNKCVIPLKPELKDIDGEEWRPVKNIGRYFGGDVSYENYYEVSNLGRVRNINLVNAAGSNVGFGYDAPTRKAMQYHLNHKSGMNTCPDIKYMVADAFLGEHNPESNMVIHKDGDYHNNNVSNLEWVPRKKTKQTTDKSTEPEINENEIRNRIRNAVVEAVGGLLEKSGIEINPENKGKFTATKKRTGKSTGELLHSKNPKTRQRANFARMAKRGWKPLEENELDNSESNFEKFVDVLEKCGWSYTDFNDVRSKSTGQTGTRFVIERDKDKSCELSELQQNLKRVIPEKLLVFSTGQHRYAPELSKKSVILLNDLSNRQLDEEWDVN